jgi:hypothetical protein
LEITLRLRARTTGAARSHENRTDDKGEMFHLEGFKRLAAARISPKLDSAVAALAVGIVADHDPPQAAIDWSVLLSGDKGAHDIDVVGKSTTHIPDGKTTGTEPVCSPSA